MVAMPCHASPGPAGRVALFVNQRQEGKPVRGFPVAFRTATRIAAQRHPLSTTKSGPPSPPFQVEVRSLARVGTSPKMVKHYSAGAKAERCAVVRLRHGAR